MKRWVTATLAALCLAVVAVLVSPQAEGITISGKFTDDNGHLFEADIDAIAAAGITKGCNPPANNHYCPDEDVDRGQMAAFLRRALELPASGKDFFVDDDTSTFEGDINAIAAVGITIGCNPPANDRFCPTDDVDRGQMAAFLRRALELPETPTNHFVDDDLSTFEGDINAIATEGITKGCNPPANTLYCPTRDVTRGEMAAFLNRALGLPDVVHRIPLGYHSSMSCSKEGERCSLTVDVSAGRPYRVQEGLFRVNGATQAEANQFDSSNTSFTLSLDGSVVSLNEIARQGGGGVTSRYWRRHLTFSSGDHTLVGEWRWAGELIQTTTITIIADG